jgi:hypothetical protein
MARSLRWELCYWCEDGCSHFKDHDLRILSATQRYLVKFPGRREHEAEISRANFYHLTPRWARWIDNTAGFGFHEPRLE